MSQSADELLKNDQRPPILYLRSFDNEAEEMTLGRALRQNFFGRLVGGGEATYWAEQDDFSAVMNWVGPYIALTRPGERRIHGAARKTVPNNKWREEVSDYIRRSNFIVLRAAISPGLKWELEQIVKYFKPTRLLCITPGRNADYQAFRNWAAQILPKGLPERLPRSRLMGFDHEWNPYPFKPKSELVETISPFFRQHGIDFPKDAFEAHLRQERTGHPLRLPNE